jgi:aspartate oxidase
MSNALFSSFFASAPIILVDIFAPLFADRFIGTNRIHKRRHRIVYDPCAFTVSMIVDSPFTADAVNPCRFYGIDIRTEPILIYPTLHYQNGGLDINADGMTTNVKNLYVAGEAVGGIHGKNRLMGNSLLDIIVFGRNAGQNAAAMAKETVVGKLTLDHVTSFETEIQAAGIETELTSPKLLPDYTRR